MASAIDLAKNIWMEAAGQPIGLGVVVTDPARAKNQLYAARTKLQQQGVAGLDAFTIRTSPANPASELWIVKAGGAA